MAGKQHEAYEVVRPFRRVDPESDDVTYYEPGEPYTGPMEIADHYISREGPDGQGPLVMARSGPDGKGPLVMATSGPAVEVAEKLDSKPAAPTNDSSKGK